MKTIRERAREYATRDKSSEYNFFEISGVNEYKRIYNEEFYAYKRGATEQKAIDIDKACNIFCHTGCPHKTDSYNCLNNKCDTWKIFRRMIEE